MSLTFIYTTENNRHKCNDIVMYQSLFPSNDSADIVDGTSRGQMPLAVRTFATRSTPSLPIM